MWENRAGPLLQCTTLPYIAPASSLLFGIDICNFSLFYLFPWVPLTFLPAAFAGPTPTSMEAQQTTTATTKRTMPVASRPPPPVARPQLPRRQSRFTEEMADDHTPIATPVASVCGYDTARSRHSAGGSRGGRGGGEVALYDAGTVLPREQRALELTVRGMNGCTHGAACVMLTAVMIEFLTQWEGYWFQHIRCVDISAFFRLPGMHITRAND